jgi:hypothetical protein
MRWYSVYAILQDGRRDLLARVTCKSDVHAMDRVSASMWPGALVFEGPRLVGILPARPGDDPDERCILPPSASARRRFAVLLGVARRHRAVPGRVTPPRPHAPVQRRTEHA